MNILVTGGAGYIGSAAVKALIKQGHSVIVADNLSKGKKKLVDKKALFFKGDLSDKTFVNSLFSNHDFDAIIHFASYKAVDESMDNPVKYSDNIIGLINVLNLMVEFGVKKIVFSSSAAVYGTPQYIPVDEDHPLDPINFYGFTKLECERLLNWYSRTKDIVAVSLRYFNVIGDAGLNYLDPDPKNVLPLIFEFVVGKREKFVVFGNDYETRDGTCIRDYIDINDLIDAHLLALTMKNSDCINLGSAKGTSVIELFEAVEKVVGKKLGYDAGPRRSGDPSKITASNTKAAKLLNWRPKVSLLESVRSSWNLYNKL